MGPGSANICNQAGEGEVRIDIDDFLAEQTLTGGTGLSICHWRGKELETDLETEKRTMRLYIFFYI